MWKLINTVFSYEFPNVSNPWVVLIFYKIIFGLLIVLILSIAVSIIPLPGNYRIYSVVSGSMEPSDEDYRVNKVLIETGELVGIKVIDHLVVGGDRFMSLS